MITVLFCPSEAYTNKLPVSTDMSAAVHAGTAARTHRGLIQHDVTAADRRSEEYLNIHAHNFTFRLSFAFRAKFHFEYDSSLSVADISKLRRLCGTIC